MLRKPHIIISTTKVTKPIAIWNIALRKPKDDIVELIKKKN